MSDCTRFRELLGGYVLGALEPDEIEKVRQHLEGCPRCRREHAELAGVPGLLEVLDAPDAAQQAPPPELEEAILDRFARERRGRGLIRMPRRRRWAIPLAAAGAAAVVAVALVLSGVFSSSDGDSAFGHVRMQGSGGARAYANLHALRAGTGVELSVRGLRPARGRVYEVWCVDDEGRWLSGGTFRVDKRGRALVSLTSAARPGEYEHVLVTRPAEGKRGRQVLAGTVEY
jgi:predicted anti-sigma-YlaC factor YlaD